MGKDWIDTLVSPLPMLHASFTHCLPYACLMVCMYAVCCVPHAVWLLGDTFISVTAVACCVLRVLCAALCVLRATFCVSRTACCMLHSARRVLQIECCVLRAACCVPRDISHVSLFLLF